jgi:hypothetical protein
MIDTTYSDKIASKVGVIIFLDALGVKHLGKEKSINFIKKRNKFLDKVKNIRDRRFEEFKRELGVNFPEPDIALFQDSIIIGWEEQKSEQGLYPFSFFQAAGQWLIDAITEAIEDGLFFRGAISQGEYIVNMSSQNVTILGPAVDDASDFFEKADWIGVIQTPDCERKYLSYLNTTAERESVRLGRVISLNDVIQHYRFLFWRYPVPLSVKKTEFFSSQKDSFSLKKDFFVSSWPVMACKKEPEVSISNILLEKSISEKPQHQTKYYNSYQFLEWYRNKFWEGLKRQPGE